MYLGFIAVCLEKARWADENLSKGSGFHSAQRVNNAVKEAAHATEIFSRSSLAGPQTDSLDFDLLYRFFNGLSYNESGQRFFGDSISPLAAFGGNGTTRQERTDPYSAVSAYLTNTAPPRQVFGFPKLLK
ncbi:MAG: hypothetical protein JNM39_04415 [Bdellovibrionaceae bacterium]|nr:hypothetical protein [Pseudobdellovibrionaceae bacterium]